MVSPEERMLEQFAESERERLMPVWRRAAARLWLLVGVLAACLLWVLAALWEAR